MVQATRKISLACEESVGELDQTRSAQPYRDCGNPQESRTLRPRAGVHGLVLLLVTVLDIFPAVTVEALLNQFINALLDLDRVISVAHQTVETD